jgi:CSLREA domain-containing protein
MSTKVVILDDDFAIRQGIKFLIKELGKDNEVEVYSSANGLEGLGFIFVVSPTVLIIDTTLPKYSGREVLEYLHTNPRFNNSKVLVLTENDKHINELHQGYVVINKREKDFANKLKNFIHVNLSNNESVNLGFKSDLINSINKYGNNSDCLMHDLSSKNKLIKPLLLLKWLYYQIMLSINLSILYLVGGKPEDSNVKQSIGDSKSFRIRAYPTLASLFVGTFLLLLQVGLFVAGGSLVFSRYRIESIAATFDRNVEMNLGDSVFDTDQVEYINGILQLKPHEKIVEQPVPDLPPEEVDSPEEEPNQEDPEGEENPVPESLTEEVLGANDINESNTIKIIEYSQEKSSIILNQEIRYTELKSVRENSSINTFESSITNPDQTIDQLKTRSFNSNTITYQLSPNKIDWYYYGGEDKWEKTEQGFESSNTIQEVNKYLEKYTPEVASNEKTVYLKIFLHSDGQTQTKLNGLTVERELNVVTELEEPPAEAGGNQVDQEPVSFLEPESYPVSLVEEVSESSGISKDIVKVIKESNPVILNASFANGNKIVSGYIEFDKANLDWVEDNIENLKVKIYYTDSTGYSENATNRGGLIGESKLFKIVVNSDSQYIWEIKEPSESGGYVAAELIYEKDDRSVSSGLSNPVENSTFTVNESGDQADFSAGDGSCDRDNVTPGSQCTLRAAIQEANALAGNDNIFFNIPISDSGYRDYDTPNTASSGDSTGGDDYWTIRPATSLPTIGTGGIFIDGGTQTTNQGNFNNGPEVELNGVTVGFATTGLNFNNDSNNSSLNSLIVNNFGTQVSIASDNFILTSSYLGTRSNGNITASTSQNIGVTILNTATNVQIGQNRANGNVVGGFGTTPSDVSVSITCLQDGITANVIDVRGNNVGVGVDGSSALPAYRGVTLAGQCDSAIGGDTANERNVIASSGVEGLNINADISNGLHNFEVYNNFFGTDVTGSLDRPNGSVSGNKVDILLHPDGDYSGAQNPIRIGGAGKGNLFRSTQSGVLAYVAREVYIEYNTFNNDFGGVSVRGYNVGPTYDKTYVRNNYFSSKEEIDPYFGVLLDDRDNFNNIEIQIYRASPIIQGNYINSNSLGIYIYFDDDHSHGPTIPIIGGSSNLTGSLCDGKEWNCFDDIGNASPTSPTSAMQGVNATPLNESTLNSDNKFTNMSFPRYELFWHGYFELMSGTARRTDITDGTVRLPFPDNTRVYTWFDDLTSGFGYLTTSLPFYEVNCATPANCPTNGSSSGVNGKTMVNMNSWMQGDFPSYDYSDMYVAQYYIDEDGNTVDTKDFKFEELHLASKNFSFDGDATTDPQSPDLGQEWTIDPSATRDVSTADFSFMQVMEVQYVDANPIFDGTDWIITVDSTTNEDNVSTCGFDDDDGAYSGGGCGGADGLPDGSTSLREAVIVAKKFDEDLKIKFDNSLIPALLPTQVITLSSDNTSNEVIIDGTGMTFDGSSQPGGSDCIEVNGGYNFEIRNFHFINCKDNAVQITSGSGITLRGNIINPEEAENAVINLDGGSEDSVGITTNDSGDADSGANNLMNYPVIEQVTYLGGGMYKIEGDIDGNNSEDPFTIEICESDILSDRSGCINILGTTIANSPWEVVVEVEGDDGDEGRVFSALATNNLGSTSEFSEAFEAIESNPNYEVAEYPIELVYPINNVLITDRDPLLDWNGNGDPDLEKYEIYFGTDPDNLDLIAETALDETDYKLSENLNFDTYYWKVIGIRANDTQSGESEVESFRVGSEISAFELTYPIDEVEIDDRTPFLTWSESTIRETAYYQIYLKRFEEGEINQSELEFNFYAKVDGIHTIEYQVLTDLQYGRYAWEVVAFYEDNAIAQRSNIEYFTVKEPVVIVPDVDVDDDLEETPVDDQEDQEETSDIGSNFLELIPLVPVALGVVTLISVAGFLTVLTGGDAFAMFGVLFGWIYRRNKKYWGIVYDSEESKVIAFATLRLYKEENGTLKFIGQSITDLKGRYGFLVEEEGVFRLEVTATGYNKSVNRIEIDSSLEVLKDIALSKIGQSNGIRSLINKVSYNRAEILGGLSRIFFILMFIGLAVTIYAITQDNNLINRILLGIYSILLLLNSYLFIKDRRNSVKAMVVDGVTNQPLDNVSVRIYDNKRQVLITLTNKLGKIKANLPKGNYRVIASKEGYVVNKENLQKEKIQMDQSAYESINPFGESKTVGEILDDQFIEIGIDDKGYFDREVELYKIT